ncbi:MAG TPA: hypothetical protein VK559_07545 [Ferruginibacter sp.]|nr:hypothetical protein [Ferruginibacter sp.]
MKITYLPIIAFLALISFASCKKSSSSAQIGSLTATIADTAYHFSDEYEYEVVNENPVFGFGGQFADTTAKAEFELTMVRFDTAKLLVKTYYETDSTVEMEVEFNQNGIEYDNGFTKIAPFQVTLTSSNQGTFSGKIYPNGDSTLPAKVVTNGKFNLVSY